MAIPRLLLIAFAFLPGRLASQFPTFRTSPATQLGASYEFTRIARGAIGPDGRIAISQPNDSKILIFDMKNPAQPSGTAGRKGEGPGEFGYLGDIGWIGSTLWATDGNRARVEFFDGAGRVRGSKLFETPGSALRGVRYNGPSALLRDTSTVYFPSLMIGPLGVPPAMVDAAIPFLLARAGARAFDTLALIRPFRSVLMLNGDRGNPVATQPLTADDFLRVGMDGQRILLVLQTGPAVVEGHVQVRVLAASGRQIFETDLGLKGRELTGSGWDSVLTRLVKAFAKDTWSSEGTARSELEKAIYRPRFLPLIAAAVMGRDGTVWLRKDLGRRADAEWLVLTPDGRTAGSVRLPASTRILDVAATGVLGVSKDTDDLEHPFWMRIAPR
ncbi:MAG: hypothetical protein ABIZ70_09160 [Gemmatimonadales bacterium]